MSEHDLQVCCFDWIRLEEQKDPRFKMIFAVPNGGKRDKATAKKLKAEGVKAGVSDIIILCPSRDYHGCAVELKWGDNETTIAQELFLLECEKYNYFTGVIRDFEDFKAMINWYFKRL